MWNPAQYLKFGAPRFRPAMDLLARIAIEAPGTVYDLGCGAGNVTRLLAQCWPNANIIGATIRQRCSRKRRRKLQPSFGDAKASQPGHPNRLST